jgi:hypothetical protein
MIHLLECLHNIPGLTFHHGYLSGEHALLEIGVLTEYSTKSSLGATPPCSGREKGQEMFASLLRKRLAD